MQATSHQRVLASADSGGAPGAERTGVLV